MKKLLSILAATTMVVSAPLSVVACGDGTGDKVDPEWDFDKTKNEFTREVSRVYQNSLAKDYSDYFFTNQQDIDKEKLFENISLTSLDKMVGSDSMKILTPGSSDFNKVASDLEKITNIDNLKKSADQEIVKNVNFKPMLIDGQNPFNNSKVEFSAISVIKMDKNAFSIQFKTESNFYYKDSTGDKVVDKVYYQSSITIFEERNTSEEMKLISKTLTEKINSTSYANSYNFESVDGRVDKNVEDMAKNSNVKNRFLAATDEVKKSNADWSNYEFKTDNLTIVGNVEDFNAANFYGDSAYIKTFSDEFRGKTGNSSSNSLDKFYDEISKSSLSQEYLKDFAKSWDDESVMTSKEQDFERPRLDPKFYNEGWTHAFNSSPTINDLRVYKNIIDASPNFKINDSDSKLASNTDNKLLGFYLVETSGIYLEYKSTITSTTVKVEMPKNQIGVRQISPIDTKKVVENFFASQITTYREMFGYNGGGSTRDQYNIVLPPSLSELKRNTFYGAEEIMLPAYEFAKEKVIENHPEYKMYLNHFSMGYSLTLQERLSYVKIGQNNELSFYDNKKGIYGLTEFLPADFKPCSSFFSKGSLGYLNIIGGFGFTMPAFTQNTEWVFPKTNKPFKVVFS
ncbi:hypothetical protein SSABA_v1c09260 [Spiroplasma sabaudiense Ar-1343]|uniref:Lipoprotein n=1 Tax=Spiroplasma sabaudiense Ar-1343 TaxID=1276257 RepID=W6AKS9_9MOLU|nr:lipoprotein [Spiroplasma sabaudiense]AHI54324.1 hypothetical protein SSABA_v1c09260 [Spiroplasma sabaudiense Ar-1343]